MNHTELTALARKLLAHPYDDYSTRDVEPLCLAVLDLIEERNAIIKAFQAECMVQNRNTPITVRCICEMEKWCDKRRIGEVP